MPPIGSFLRGAEGSRPEVLPPDLLSAVEDLYTSFSKVDAGMFNKLDIPVRPLWQQAPDLDIKAYGLVEMKGNWLDIDATWQLYLIQEHVSIINEAGSCMLINVFLLCLASVMHHREQVVSVIPEFPIRRTTLEDYAFGGVVNFLITRAPPGSTKLLLGILLWHIHHPAALQTPQLISLRQRRKMWLLLHTVNSTGLPSDDWASTLGDRG
ncbi:hypothetical protein BKA82DRAFT_4014000 [Pisolithus tinctorius]|nr:hypothetical protein BKA82DRAFT_4014000 [Pisolithus tinctorius]